MSTLLKISQRLTEGKSDLLNLFVTVLTVRRFFFFFFVNTLLHLIMMNTPHLQVFLLLYLCEPDERAITFNVFTMRSCINCLRTHFNATHFSYTPKISATM